MPPTPLPLTMSRTERGTSGGDRFDLAVDGLVEGGGLGLGTKITVWVVSNRRRRCAGAELGRTRRCGVAAAPPLRDRRLALQAEAGCFRC